MNYAIAFLGAEGLLQVFGPYPSLRKAKAKAADFADALAGKERHLIDADNDGAVVTFGSYTFEVARMRLRP